MLQGRGGGCSKIHHFDDILFILISSIISILFFNKITLFSEGFRIWGIPAENNIKIVFQRNSNKTIVF